MSVNGNSLGSQLINGRYRILYPLQEGGFGQTFLVEDTHLPSQRRCVLKLLKPVDHNPEFYRLVQDRFQREAAIQETLGEVCQQIPRLYAYFSEGERFYLVEEWIDGETLSTKVAEVGRFSEAAVAEILNQLLPTIDTVHHHQIVHRDIKPDNIILRKRDGKPVLIDFGAVKESMGAVLTSHGASAHSIVIGTSGYMPPEQSAGRPLYASDLYSLGMTAVYLLTGKSPSELYSDPQTGKVEWQSQAPQVSAALSHVIDTAIQMYPRDRFKSAQAMRQALQAALPSGQPETPVDIPTLISRPQSSGPSQNGFPDQSPSPQPMGQPIPVPLVQGQPDQSRQPQTPGSVQQPYPELTVGTEVVAPAMSEGVARRVSADNSGSWIKAALIGGGIGAGLLLGLLLLLRPHQSVEVPVVQRPLPSASDAPSASSTPSAPAVASSPEPSQTASPEPSLAPAVEPASEPASTATETCGDPSGSGPDWYPVFIDGRNLSEVRQKYCQDALPKTRDDGTPSIQVASFTDRQRAESFADRVGGAVGSPYQVAKPQPSPAPSSAGSSQKSSAPDAGTNATIVGDSSAKNIRVGPGGQFAVQHIAYAGDRVSIRSSDQDSGGYIWYQIYFPRSGASGWIAGQLLKPD